MIQILLFILKLIGWILLGILGIILGILLLVLFCAVRYRLDGKKEEKLEGKLYITWLFRAVSLVIGYQDGLLIQAKLLGKTLWKLDRQDGVEEASATDNKEEPKDGEKPKEVDKPKETDKEKDDGKKKKADKAKKDVHTEKKDKIKVLQSEWNTLEAERERLLAREKAEKGQAETGAHEKKSLWEKIKDRIVAWIEKLKFSFSEICGKLRQIEEKRQWFLEKWNWLSEMVHDPENQVSVRLILRQIKKIFRHVLPRKGSASLILGREDPYLMGKLLGYAGAAYPFTHKFLILHPVFGENRMEGEVHIRGRIRLGVILGFVLRLLFNKNIRRRIKEVLHGR